MSSINTKSKKYKKDFLKIVVVKIDFDTPLPIASTGPKKNVYDALMNRFPITEEKTLFGKELSIGPDVTLERSIKKKEWHYYGKSREKHLTISTDFLSIDYNKYEFYENLRDDFLSVSNALFEAYPKSQAKRLGLRYIDEIQFHHGNPIDWDKYLRPELNSVFALTSDKRTISRAFHVIEFNYGEDLLRFQFGMFNPDYPAPIKRKIYTLDYDMYVTKLLDRAEIGQKLDRFHEKVNNFFEEVITDELRKIMEPLNE